jgi:hypothetical protein
MENEERDNILIIKTNYPNLDTELDYSRMNENATTAIEKGEQHSFISDVSLEREHEYSIAQLKQVVIDDDVPEPDMDMIIDPVEVKPKNVDNYYNWMFEKAMSTLPENICDVSDIGDVNMCSVDINYYYDELTFNYFNSFN